MISNRFIKFEGGVYNTRNNCGIATKSSIKNPDGSDPFESFVLKDLEHDKRLNELEKLIKQINENQISSEDLSQAIETISDEIKLNIFNIDNTEFLIGYVKDIADIEEFNKYYYSKIDFKALNSLENQFPMIVNKIININKDELLNIMFTGHIVIITKDLGYSFLIPKNTSRSISNSIIDPTDLYSSQDGFIENIDINIALIRKHLNSNKLNVEFTTWKRFCFLVYNFRTFNK